VARDLKVLAWITEGGWEACVDAAAGLPATETTLLHVPQPDLAHGPPGPLGRRRRLDIETRWTTVSGEAAQALLDDAERRLGRPAKKLAVDGPAEQVVLEAARDADVLVLVRDGREDTPGPHSIGHATRFVLDHAPCTILLAWA
jgi:nucleotide-binding universal stress UspA family protein